MGDETTTAGMRECPELFRSAEFMPTVVREPIPGEKTVVAIGLVRGGGSLVGAVLDALGVYMGPKKELYLAGTFENFQLRIADAEAQLKEVARCNDAYGTWGWKTGEWKLMLGGLPASVRNPHWIFTFRDALAIAQRRKLSEPSFTGTVSEIATEVNSEYAEFLSYMSSGTDPCLAVSYQRAIQRPELLIYALCNFLDLQPSPAQFMEAMRRVNFRGGYYYAPENIADIRKLRDTVKHLAAECQCVTQQAELEALLTRTQAWILNG